MLNHRKVRLMTRLAMYEKKEGKEDIRLSKYYRTDFVRLNVLKSIVAMTAGYLFVLLILVLYNAEYLIGEAVRLDYKTLIARYVSIYLVLLSIYFALPTIGYMLKYRFSRRKLAKYFRMLRRLRTMYNEEDGGMAAEEEESSENDSDNT